jgi:hypothetical protein
MPAASERATATPSAPKAPYMLACESAATQSSPGRTCPRSIMTWCPIPVPAAWNSIP